MKKSTRSQKSILFASTTAQRWKNNFVRNMVLEEMREDYSDEFMEDRKPYKNEQFIDSSKSSPEVVNNSILEYKQLKLKKIKFEVLLLTFIFHEDDGILSTKEENIIKKHFRKYKKTMQQDDYEELSKMKPIDSIAEIIKYIKQESISNIVIKETITLLENITRNNSQYIPVIIELKDNILKGDQ